MQKKLFGVEEAGIQFIDKIQRNTQDCSSGWKWGSLSGYFCAFWAKFAPPPQLLRPVSDFSNKFKQEIYPRLLGPRLHLLSGHQPQVATCPLTCHPRNSWCCHCSGPGLLKKNKKSRLIASGCERAMLASAPNHPLPRQHSSRQQLQQINHPLTVHLDWINLELGAITAIGRRGYSPNAGCYPALGIKKKRPLFSPLSL